MEKPDPKDVGTILGFLIDCYSQRGLEAFERWVVSALPAVVPCDLAVYQELVWRGPRSVHCKLEPRDRLFPGVIGVFQRYAGDNPFVEYRRNSGDAGAIRLSDIVSASEFGQTGLYRNFYRRIGAEHCLEAAIRLSRQRVVAVALYRSQPDFSEEERLRLNALHPHLIAAYRNAEAATRAQHDNDLLARAVEATGRGVVILVDDWRIWLQSPRARQWMAEYFGETRRQGELPASLVRQIRDDGNGDMTLRREPLVIDRDGKRLAIRFLSEQGRRLLLFEEYATRLRSETLTRLGLSAREAEVLRLVSEGRTNVAAARLLGLSPRTIQTHLERVYRKLNVNTRAAATARAAAAGSDAPARSA